MKEKDFEDIIVRYPELIESGLQFAGRQVNVKGKFVDVLYTDRHSQNLILELKAGTILRKHIAQLMDYEGYFLTSDNPTVRVMLVGNRVPINLRRALDHHGFEWREIGLSKIIEFLKEKNDTEYLKYFSSEDLDHRRVEHVQSEMVRPLQKGQIRNSNTETKSTRNIPILDKMLNVFENRVGEEFTRKQIIDLVVSTYPGTNKTSVIPSDYCYNIINRGINFQNHLFEHLEFGHYIVLGVNYDYEGPIFLKGEQVGEWKKGEKKPRISKYIAK